MEADELSEKLIKVFDKKGYDADLCLNVARNLLNHYWGDEEYEDLLDEEEDDEDELEAYDYQEPVQKDNQEPVVKRPPQLPPNEPKSVVKRTKINIKKPDKPEDF